MTLDLDGGVVVRGKDAGTGAVRELYLARSPAAGPPARVALDRAVLARALALGCHTVRVSPDGKPVVAEGDDRTFVALPLDPSAVVVPTPGAARTSTAGPARPGTPTTTEERRTDVKARPRDANGHDPAARPGPPPADGPDPLAEAEALKAALADAAQRAGRLVARAQTVAPAEAGAELGVVASEVPATGPVAASRTRPGVGKSWHVPRGHHVRDGDLPSRLPVIARSRSCRSPPRRPGRPRPPPGSCPLYRRIRALGRRAFRSVRCPQTRDDLAAEAAGLGWAVVPGRGRRPGRPGPPGDRPGAGRADGVRHPGGRLSGGGRSDVIHRGRVRAYRPDPPAGSREEGRDGMVICRAGPPGAGDAAGRRGRRGWRRGSTPGPRTGGRGCTPRPTGTRRPAARTWPPNSVGGPLN